VDMATKEELIAARMSVQEIAKYIGADSLGYLSLERLREAVGKEVGGYCQACFSGDYPVAVVDGSSKRAFEKA
jgi:amidophosphoribosyltransferase